MLKAPIQGIAAVIPVYNEADNVKHLLMELQTALKHYPHYEIIFVDDGSQDLTVETLRPFTTQIPQLKIIQHIRNFGQSASIVSGVRAATMDWVVTLDGDAQNDPADITKLVQVAEEEGNHYVMIAGNRTKRDDTWIRRISSRIANRIRAHILKDDCPDTGCSLKLFPRKAFLQLPHFNHCHRFLPALFKRAGYQVINVAVSHRPRIRGISKYGIHNRLWTGIVDLIGMMWLINRPCQPEVKEIDS